MRTSTIRILQATAWYPPYDMGGTEVYLESLIGELRALGVESSVLVPRNPRASVGYVHAGTSVETYAVNEVPAPDEMRDSRPHLQFGEFQARLAAHKGGIYHQHAWSRGCGPHHLRAARELGLATVLTVHVPGTICLRGTMLCYGTRPCNGRVEERLCGACWAQGRGMPRALADALARLPLAIAQHARRGRTRAATALAGRALGAERGALLGDMIRNADRVVAVCAWLRDALAANGVPPERLVLSRQGLPSAYLHAARAAVAPRPCETDGALKLLYVGRWHPVKGIDVAVRALRALPAEVRVKLTVHAVPGTGGEEAAYERNVRTLADGDPRIAFAPPLLRNEIAAAMSRYDALVVPSLWLETGPLVVLEALAAGLYVMGSRLGGIAELVADDGGGELVEAGNVSAWTAAVARLAKRHGKELPIRRPRKVRSMAVVAAEMAALYQSLPRG